MRAVESNCSAFAERFRDSGDSDWNIELPPCHPQGAGFLSLTLIDPAFTLRAEPFKTLEFEMESFASIVLTLAAFGFMILMFTDIGSAISDRIRNGPANRHSCNCRAKQEESSE